MAAPLPVTLSSPRRKPGPRAAVSTRLCRYDEWISPIKQPVAAEAFRPAAADLILMTRSLQGSRMTNIAVTDDLFFTRTGMDPNRVEKLVGELLHGMDDDRPVRVLSELRDALHPQQVRPMQRPVAELEMGGEDSPDCREVDLHWWQYIRHFVVVAWHGVGRPSQATALLIISAD